MPRTSMQPASPRDKLFEALPEGPRAGTPAEATRSTFARTGILPSQAIRALIAQLGNDDFDIHLVEIRCLPCATTIW